MPRVKWNLKTRTSRASTVFASKRRTICTYTIDKDYIAALQLTDKTYRKVLPLGHVMAYNPTSQKVVPHYTSYGFGQVGVTIYDVDCGTEALNYDRVIELVWAGEVHENHCWDNGTYGAVLAATKAALAARISFVKVATTGAGAKGFM